MRIFYNQLMDRKSAVKFIHANFGGVIEDSPWQDSPEYTVFRHTDNRKWFALFATVSYATLAKQNPQRFAELTETELHLTVDILNLKSDPDLIEEITKAPGILPAYHMSKRHWLTVLLDGSCPSDQIKDLISMSYNLTVKHFRYKVF